MLTKRARLWLSRSAVIAVAVISIGLAVGAWHYSSRIEHALLRFPDDRRPDRIIGEEPDRGLDHVEVLIGGPLGDYPAWLIEGERDLWVIFVHGVDADRREALRVLPAIVDAGYPGVVITYRNDGEAPADGSGRHTLGRSEWPDLRAAVQFARAEGAASVVLFGFGTGGSVVASFISHGLIEGVVSGVVLDAPALDVSERIDRMGTEDKAPGFLVTWARAMTTFRFGIDWSALDHVNRADDFTMPVLILHGEDDTVYPISVSRSFADAVRHAEVVGFPGAGHGESWNVDPEGYETAVLDFLDRLSGD